MVRAFCRTPTAYSSESARTYWLDRRAERSSLPGSCGVLLVCRLPTAQTLRDRCSFTRGEILRLPPVLAPERDCALGW